ncbi:MULTISPECIES: response regulator [unclassified Fusibacter]|uniref:response regulator n=1 Tax=unclassified Fusibacter TaxID=2624464 RepID=UPI001013085D|nr:MULTISPECIES: response regulator [unclassified Fusibacter]MCK8061390.1 response regulator [Fusibacter sp. A2]NPE23567.1 hybrid sensor histidine kinase/response regulator [Fusibacter sp. A1]RXV58977.1 hybrid sensor histidine kinase/response regulator [Fusibacter sp. A1]
MKILIVDDSRLIRMQTKNLMALNFPDVQLEVAENGDECMKLIKRFRPDIILLDIVMPGISGIEVLQLISSKIEEGYIKVIMFSSLDDQVTLKQCFELGASDFISKPIEELETVARLEAAIKSMSLFKDLKGANEKLESKNKELLRLNEELMETRVQLTQSEKLAGIGQLADGVAFEISSPVGFASSNLATLRMYSQYWMSLYDKLLQKNNLKSYNPEAYEIVNSPEFNYMISDIKSIFDDTEASLTRTKGIIQSLKSFSRADQQTKKNWVDLNKGVSDTISILRSRIESTAMITLDLRPIPLFLGYGSQLNQVILNVILNAVYAIEEKFDEGLGAISIKSDVKNDFVRLQICDNGLEIPQKLKENLMSNQMANHSFDDDIGRGVGLSMAYDIIVNIHGGRVQIKTDLTMGTCINIELPVD